MKPTMNRLISQLHDAIANEQPSPESARLLRELNGHMENWKDETPEATLTTTVEALLIELEVSHPQAVSIARKMVDTLASMGI